MGMHTITVKAFGIVAEKMGVQQLVVNQFLDVQSFKDWLETEYPSVKQLSYTISLDHQLLHENIVFAKDGEIALLPPYSGG